MQLFIRSSAVQMYEFPYIHFHEFYSVNIFVIFLYCRSDIPENHSPSKGNQLSKKHRPNLSTLKSKKKVRYERVSNAVENEARNSLKDDLQVCQTSYTNETPLVEGDENLFSDPNESTKLYQNFAEQRHNGKVHISDEEAVRPKVLAAVTEGVHCPPQRQVAKVSVSDREVCSPVTEEVCYPSREQGAKVSDEASVCPKVCAPVTEDARHSSQQQGAKMSVSDEVSVCPKVCVPDTEDVQYSPQQQDAEIYFSDGVSVHPDILVPDTEDVYPEEADIGSHCSIGFPSAASTPLAAANSPLFGYDSDNGDDGDDDISVGILRGATETLSCNDTVNLLTAAKTQLSNLPKSDSQFPVDLSFSQPQSPTVPSRTRSLQQDLNLTADCSVSLLPHGMKNEENESKNELKSGGDSTKNSNDTVFVSSKKNEQQIHPERGENRNYPMKKVSKQTTLDGKLLKVKECGEESDTNAGKRKRELSDEHDNFAWPSENENEHVSVRRWVVLGKRPQL